MRWASYWVIGPVLDALRCFNEDMFLLGFSGMVAEVVGGAVGGDTDIFLKK
jgi:hypothetical protein